MATGRFKAAVKYVASFLKSDWELKDYPIRFRQLRSERDVNGDDSIKWDRWIAQIVNWWQMNGGGQTREEAYENLMKQFEDYRRTGPTLPRPGTEVPIEVCPTDEIDCYQDIARDFLKRILDIDYDDPWCIITDASSLWEFTLLDDVTDDELVAKAQAEYEVDISDIKDGSLVAIFKRIQQRRSA